MLEALAYILLCGLAFGHLFRLLRLPALLGMLLTGILLGPHALNQLPPTLLAISPEIRQAALVIILLRAGLALDPKELRTVGRPALLLSFLPALFEIAGVLLIAPPLLGMSLAEAALLGTVIAAVSPAVIVPKMLHLIEQRYGTAKRIPQMITAAASVDDIFVIVLFTACTALVCTGSFTPATLSAIPLSILSGITIGILLGITTNRLFRRFHLRDSIKLIILISLSFLLTAIEKHTSDTIPFSALLAIMTLGVTLRHTYPKLALRIAPKFSKLWITAEILLFVLVGAEVNTTYATDAGLVVLLLLAGALLFRTIGVSISLLNTPLNPKERIFCAIAYLPKATVQAAIGAIPLSLGLPCGTTILTVAIVAILLTAPLGAIGIDRTYSRLLHHET